MALPGNTGELAALCRLLHRLGVSPRIMGNGTNLLFPDEGLDAVVIKTAGCCEIGTDHGAVTAACGASLAKTAAQAQAAGLAGLEFAHGIPGSVGGGAVMNAGAYGGELKDVLARTEYLDGDMNEKVLCGAEQELSYRHSFFSDRPGVVLRCVFVLSPDEPERIARRMRELAEKRRASQPLDMPSAGSVFKRPESGYAAALIEEAGLKGCAVGGAQVSPKHAGFIVNTGSATCGDVLALMEHIQKTVFDRSGVMLEPEIRIIRG